MLSIYSLRKATLCVYMKKNDSICTRNKYCGFDLVFHNAEVQKECCRFCGKRVMYKLTSKGDAADKFKYARDHVRDIAQPFGPTRRIFYEIYGEKPVEDVKAYIGDKKTKEQRKRDFDEGWKEQLDWATERVKVL